MVIVFITLYYYCTLIAFDNVKSALLSVLVTYASTFAFVAPFAQRRLCLVEVPKLLAVHYAHKTLALHL